MVTAFERVSRALDRKRKASDEPPSVTEASSITTDLRLRAPATDQQAQDANSSTPATADDTKASNVNVQSLQAQSSSLSEANAVVCTRKPLQMGSFISPPWDPIRFPTSFLTSPRDKSVRYKMPDDVDMCDALLTRLQEVVGQFVSTLPIFYASTSSLQIPKIVKVVCSRCKGVHYVDLFLATYEQAAWLVYKLRWIRVDSCTLTLYSHGIIHDPRLVGITIVPHQRQVAHTDDVTAVFSGAIAALQRRLDDCELKGAWFHARKGDVDGDNAQQQVKASCVFYTPDTFEMESLPVSVVNIGSTQQKEVYDSCLQPEDTSGADRERYLFRVYSAYRIKFCPDCFEDSAGPVDGCEWCYDLTEVTLECPQRGRIHSL